MENVKTIEINKLLVMFIIAMGEWNGSQWEYFPKLPSCFTENNNLAKIGKGNSDFLRLTVNDQMRVECWFSDEDGELFYLDLIDVKFLRPLLFTSIVTHMYDMIENVKDC